MSSSPTTFLALAAALLLAAVTGCNPPPFVESPAGAEAASLDEGAAAARFALAELGAARFGGEAGADLARAERWLDAVDRAIADGEGDDPQARLALRATEAAIAAIKSFYVRREAEEVLADVRVELVHDQREIDALDQENLRLLESPENLP